MSPTIGHWVQIFFSNFNRKIMPRMFISHNKAKYALISDLTRPSPTRPAPASRFLNAYISETIWNLEHRLINKWIYAIRFFWSVTPNGSGETIEWNKFFFYDFSLIARRPSGDFRFLPVLFCCKLYALYDFYFSNFSIKKINGNGDKHKKSILVIFWLK